MINLSVWCPFERVASIFKRMAADEKVDNLSIEFDGFSDRSLSNQPVNAALGFSISDRKKFLQMEEVTGRIKFDGQVSEFVVFNELFTSSPVVASAIYRHDGVDEVVTNGILDGKDVCYPEAILYSPSSFELGDIDNIEKSVRPYYSLVYFGKSDGVHYISGPGISNEEFHFAGHASTNGAAYKLYTRRQQLPEKVKELVVAKEETLKGFSVILEPDGDPSRGMKFLFSQTVLVDSKHYVSYEAIFVAWAFGIAIEHGYLADRIDQYGQLHIPIALDPTGHWVINQEWMEIYRNEVYPLKDIGQILDPYFYTRDSLSIKRGRDYLMLSAKYSTKSCFALTLSAFLCLSGTHMYTDMALTLNRLIDADVQLLVKGESDDGQNYVLVGNTSNIPPEFSISLADGSRKFKNLKRTLVRGVDFLKQLDSVAGYVIFGFDPDHNRSVGVPDHYVLAKVEDGQLLCVFDPYRNNAVGFKYRQDLTSYLNQTDSLIYLFNSSVEIGQVSMDLTEFGIIGA